MKRSLAYVVLLLSIASAHAQDVIYLKRSEVFGFVMGQQIGTAAGQVLEARQYAAQRQAGYQKLDALRKDLAQCGNCAQRDALAKQVQELRDGLLRQDGMLCGAFDALADGNPAVPAMKKVMGFDPVCNRYFSESSIMIADERHKRNKEEFAARVKAGDMAAYSSMGRKVMTTFRNLSVEQRLDMACPYWAEGARKNDRMSITFLTDECQSGSTNSGMSRKEAASRLQTCSANDHLCAQSLAVTYETTRRKDRTWAVEADDREALRLYEQVVAHYESEHAKWPKDSTIAAKLDSSRKDASRVRQRLASN
ncbi:hypothetical protein QTI66_34675 [Variovorax sp. J22R133]|uniref:hypothetical protein n=1 Tax=Variovorax brevis TaxID=3053503 RepID=UPI0025765DD2|nr:hypothetical protein [Variovorax sp. J22R133]MDM0117267.1 hypothetical protein [Variovorax sp. J22R133]